MSGARSWGTVVLTGATSGIGHAAARLIVERCDLLILQGPEPAEEVEEALGRLRGHRAEVRYVACDFTSLRRAAGAAQRIRDLSPRGIDLVINDAAVPGAPERMVTADGFERTLQVNALAPALLTRLLVPALSPGSRVVNVGSSAHRVESFHFDDLDLEGAYTPVAAYARAKLAMVTWSSLLADEEAGRLTVVALCPGLTRTPLSAAMAGPIGGPAEAGAARVLFAATADVPSGSYLEDDRVVLPSREVTDHRNRARVTSVFWERLSPYALRSGS